MVTLVVYVLLMIFARFEDGKDIEKVSGMMSYSFESDVF